MGFQGGFSAAFPLDALALGTSPSLVACLSPGNVDCGRETQGRGAGAEESGVPGRGKKEDRRGERGKGEGCLRSLVRFTSFLYN